MVKQKEYGEGTLSPFTAPVKITDLPRTFQDQRFFVRLIKETPIKPTQLELYFDRLERRASSQRGSTLSEYIVAGNEITLLAEQCMRTVKSKKRGHMSELAQEIEGKNYTRIAIEYAPYRNQWNGIGQRIVSVVDFLTDHDYVLREGIVSYGNLKGIAPTDAPLYLTFFRGRKKSAVELRVTKNYDHAILDAFIALLSQKSNEHTLKINGATILQRAAQG